MPGESLCQYVLELEFVYWIISHRSYFCLLVVVVRVGLQLYVVENVRVKEPPGQIDIAAESTLPGMPSTVFATLSAALSAFSSETMRYATSRNKWLDVSNKAL